MKSKKSPEKEKGVVAKKLLPKGTLIEAAPVSSFPVEEWTIIKKTEIFKYCFVLPKEYRENNQNADGYIVFGLSSFCNHSENPNAYIKWTQDEVGLWAHLIALADIQPEEEVLVFYTNIDEYPLAQ